MAAGDCLADDASIASLSPSVISIARRWRSPTSRPRSSRIWRYANTPMTSITESQIALTSRRVNFMSGQSVP